MKNVKLDDLLETKTVEVPGTEIVLKVQDLSWPEFMESIEIEDITERGLYRLVKVIKEWNLVDTDDKPLEISKENISKIPASIIMPIIDVVQEYFGESQKKKIKREGKI